MSQDDPKRYFTEWSRLDARPYIAYRGEPSPSNRHLRTTNAFYSFWFVERGNVRITAASEALDLRPGQWVFFPPHYNKRQDFEDGTVILSLGFEANWANGSSWMRFDHPISGTGSREDDLIEAAHLVVAVLDGSRTEYLALSDRRVDAGGLVEFYGRLYHFLALLTPVLLANGAETNPAAIEDSRLAMLLREFQTAPSIRPLPYARWRREIGLGRVHIDRLTRTHLGATPRKLRDRLLLAAIKRQLLIGRASTKETAAQFGFSDTSHLCRWFRRHAGVAPEVFRRHGSG